MAKVITTELQHSGASGANITLDSSKNVTFGGNVSVTGTLPADKLTGNLPAISGASLTGVTDTLPFRNLIVNGASQVAQRGTTSVAANTTCADMFKFDCTTGGGNPSGITMQRVADGPDGFEYSQKVTMGGSTWTPTSGNVCYFQHNIEAQNLAHLEYGTANAKTLTLSFWVKASVTGEYSVALTNNTQAAVHDHANRNYITSYTISSANTWEKKTATFTGDTSGTWAKTGTGSGMCPVWDIGSGTNHEASTGSWQAGADFRKAGTIKIGDTASSTWQITGVQLEEGSTATDFEHKPYSYELARCQRYFYQILDGTRDGTGNPGMPFTWWSSSDCRALVTLPTTMRLKASSMSVVQANSGSNDWKFVGTGSSSPVALDCDAIEGNENFALLAFYSVSPTGTAGQSGWITADDAANKIGLSAEL